MAIDKFYINFYQYIFEMHVLLCYAKQSGRALVQDSGTSHVLNWTSNFVRFNSHHYSVYDLHVSCIVYIECFILNWGVVIWIINGVMMGSGVDGCLIIGMWINNKTTNRHQLCVYTHQLYSESAEKTKRMKLIEYMKWQTAAAIAS